MELKEQAQSKEPSIFIQEIRARMAKLDRVEEILLAVDSMREVVGSSHEPLPRSR